MSEMKPSAEERACTCHPDDKPPIPCARRFAYSDCVAYRDGAAAERARILAFIRDASRRWDAIDLMAALRLRALADEIEKDGK